MAMKRYYVLLLSAVLLLFTKSTHGHVGEIIELTDATFEHQTQVGTGTGTVRQTGTGATTNTARTLPPPAAVILCSECTPYLTDTSLRYFHSQTHGLDLDDCYQFLFLNDPHQHIQKQTHSPLPNPFLL
jgi:hypothetical protein